MATSSLDHEKRALRKLCAAHRDGLPETDRRAAGQAIAGIGIGFAGATAGATVSAYVGMGSEIDPAAIVARLAAEGFATCLPVVQPLGQPLVFRAWAPGEPLVPRTWGILEPEASARAVEPDVLLVPLLAFDANGNRLGYGGGYYDRTLARLRAIKPIIAIGLALAAQRVEEVPYGPYDQRLDWILTEAGSQRPSSI